MKNIVCLRRFLITVLFLLLSVVLFAEEEPQILPELLSLFPKITEEQQLLLKKGDPVLHFHPEKVNPVLLPDLPLSWLVTRKMMASELNIGIEGLFFTPEAQLPPSYRSTPAEKRQLKLYNILRSLSTLQGLEYFSSSRGKMRLLFEESWIVSDPKSRTALPDPVFTTIPVSDKVYVHQRDKSFGTNLQEVSYISFEQAMSAAIVNVTPMRYKGLVKIAESGDMQTHLLVVPVREGVLVYGTMSAKTKDVKSFLDRARNSFTTRVIALSGWYRDRLKEEFLL